jgi:membrane fusion protein (multidrug efflux system)
MLLTVAIETSPRLGLSVPELALVGEGEGRFVYVVGADGAAKRVSVRTGLRSAGRVEILEGLKPGQKVVTEGVVKLSDGMKVRLAGPNAGAGAAGGGAKGGKAGGGP